MPYMLHVCSGNMSHRLNVCRRNICPAGFMCGQKTLKYYSSGDMSCRLHMWTGSLL